jgi:hypothetical protein
MPFLVAAIVGALAQVMGSLVGRALLALGFSYVTYSGMSVASDFIAQQMQSSIGSIGGEIGSFLRFCAVDVAINMIISAFAASVAIKQIGGGITKMVLKK